MDTRQLSFNLPVADDDQSNALEQNLYGNKHQACDESDDYFFNSDDDSPIMPGEKESRLFSDGDQDHHAEIDLRTPLLDINDRVLEDGSGEDEGLGQSWYEFVFSWIGGRTSRVQSSEDIAIAAIFLRDYENSRPHSLPSSIGAITPLQLFVHRVRYSFVWQYIGSTAIACLFLSSCFDGESTDDRIGNNSQFALTLFAALVFTADVTMRTIHDGSVEAGIDAAHHARKTRARRWKLPTVIMLFAVTVETYVKTAEEGKAVVWTGCFKPIVFFYASSKARDGELNIDQNFELWQIVY